ncbi:MAG: sulfite exporter TauE/SafE family protein [Rhodobacteraceae bacterium]|nr:sulfite exporter TauE/SafE family protein [Paracoccaceae bacterium]
MQVYLPIAEMSVNALLLLSLGAGVGVISGLFGVGGGFLMTPMLIFVGVPPAVAVSTQAPQIVASSLSGVLAHWKRRAVDVKMGLVLLVGGLAGSAIGVQLFSWLRELGQVEFAVTLLYVVFLGIVGVLMAVESVTTLRRNRNGTPPPPSKPRRRLIHRLPFKMSFKQSKLYISVIPVLVIGFTIGVLGAIMGVGGGFIMLPAMIYLLGVPTNVVVGTSLFQIMFVMAFTALLHSVQNQTVDAVLALLLLLGGVIGAQIGAALGASLRGEQLRLLLAAVVLAVCLKLAIDLTVTPSELFSITSVGDMT